VNDRGIKSRVLFVALLLVAAFSGVALRLFEVQVVEREKWQKRAEVSYARTVPLPAKRGVIYDRNGEQLVHNLPTFSMAADRIQLEDPLSVMRCLVAARGRREGDPRAGETVPPAVMSEYRGQIARVLARSLDGSEADWLARLDFGRRQWVVLQKDLTTDEVRPIRQALERAGIRGIVFEEGSRRFYPGGTFLCHVLGFADHEGRGREGVEGSMDRWLEGEPGFRRIMVDRKGREIHRGEEKPARNGGNAHLTIHSGLQTLLEEELAAARGEYKLERVCAVLVDPATGDILALANHPVFDTNTRLGERRNFAFSDVYEPGSTFKMVATAAGLDSGVVNLETRIFCHHGRLVEGKLSVPDHSPYGWLTVEQVFAKSSNIGTFQIARMVGLDRYYEYVANFGFGRRTGLPLSSENSGVVRNNRNLVDFSRASFGYAVSVTPVQLAYAYSVLANDGVRMKPRLVDRVTDERGRVLWQNPVESRGRVISARAATQTTRAMCAVTDDAGTGTRARVEGYTVAGKTGTARRYDPATRQYQSSGFVSFAGFLPADNPRLVCVVVGENPQTTGVSRYGGTIAAPIFARIAGRAMRVLDVPPDVNPRPRETASTE